MALVYGLLVGIVMGVLIQRVGASNPRMILAALRLEDLTIIKFMATTIAVGMVGVYALGRVIPMHLDIKPTYVLGVLAGGLVFGVGFAIGGYCPGTCVVGLGERRTDALFALLGGIVGALAFTLLYRLLEAPLIKPLSYGKITLADLLHAPPLSIAVVVAAIFAAVMWTLPTTRVRPTNDV
jgi:hypothetical protein